MSGLTVGGGEGISKMLPQVPDMDTQIALAAKMIDKKTSTPKGSHSYGAYYQEYSLIAEFSLLRSQRLPGIYCLPSAESPNLWWGVLFIRQGVYQEGVFRFRVVIPAHFPDAEVPSIVFEAPVFHPCIDPTTHRLNVKQGFPKWKRNVNHIWQLLLYTRKLFYRPEPGKGGVANPEAATLFSQDLEAFRTRVRGCVLEWKERLYSGPEAGVSDEHYFKFSPYQPDIHDAARSLMKAGKVSEEDGDECDDSVKSYVAPGSLTIFSEDIIPESGGPLSHPQ